MACIGETHKAFEANALELGDVQETNMVITSGRIW
jgi:hypothetical protein